MKLRFNVWKDWYKRCLDGRVYKIMVLLGLRHSPNLRDLTGINMSNLPVTPEV